MLTLEVVGQGGKLGFLEGDLWTSEGCRLLNPFFLCKWLCTLIGTPALVGGLVLYQGTMMSPLITHWAQSKGP